MHKVNIADKFSKISEYWKPHIAGELNGQMVKLVKANTEFVWHHHDHEDEMFLVVKGRFRMEFKEKTFATESGANATNGSKTGRVYRRSPRRRPSSRRRRGMLDHALRTGVHPQHRQRRERTHPTPTGTGLGIE